MTILIKIILAALLLICLADMPYGYFQLVRFIGLIGFSILCYQAYLRKKDSQIILYAGLALLFQPFFKVALGREIWNILDVLVAFLLLFSLKNLLIKVCKPSAIKLL